MVALAHFLDNLTRPQGNIRMPGIVRLERAAGNPGLQTTVFAAIAWHARGLGGGRKRQRIMAPLARAIVRSVVSAAAYSDSGARTAAQDDSKNDIEDGDGTIHCLGRGKAVGIILDTNWSLKSLLQIGLNRLAQKPG